MFSEEIRVDSNITLLFALELKDDKATYLVEKIDTGKGVTVKRYMTGVFDEDQSSVTLEKIMFYFSTDKMDEWIELEDYGIDSVPVTFPIKLKPLSRCTDNVEMALHWVCPYHTIPITGINENE
jgi:hypothetical protein